MNLPTNSQFMPVPEFLDAWERFKDIHGYKVANNITHVSLRRNNDKNLVFTFMDLRGFVKIIERIEVKK